MNEHLGDNELQQYTVEPRELSQAALTHIAICEHCRVKAQQYAQITAGLKHLPKMTAELDLPILVLPVKRQRFSLSGLAVGALIFAGLLVIAAGIAAMGPDFRALLSVGKGLHFYLLLTAALILLTAGSAFYYSEYKQQLKKMSHLS